MIKANELRRGNAVLAKSDMSGIEEVIEIEDIIGERGVNWMYIDDMSGPEYSFMELYPIPITAEWLERVGLKRGNDERDRNLFYGTGIHSAIYSVSLSGGVMLQRTGNKLLERQIRYVHQLQNLYFALTGEELAFGNR